MIRCWPALLVALALPPAAFAQSGGGAADSVRAEAPAPPPAPAAKKGPRKIYYGGSVGLVFGDFTRVSVQPMVGYHFTPRFSAGGKGTYEYFSDDRHAAADRRAETGSSHNYGFGTFGRYKFVPGFYGHAELAATSYEFTTAAGVGERDWVPFLYLGGGYARRVSKSVSAYAEILVDVWQDDDSPYDWEPQLSFGIGVGF